MDVTGRDRRRLVSVRRNITHFCGHYLAAPSTFSKRTYPEGNRDGYRSVKWFDDDQSLGLITADDAGRDALGTPQQGTDRHGLKRQEEDHDGEAHT